MTAPESVPYASVGSVCFDAQHDYVELVADDEVEEAVSGIEADFSMISPAIFAERLRAVIEAVAVRHCVGCKDVACRIVMLIEDLENEVNFPRPTPLQRTRALLDEHERQVIANRLERLEAELDELPDEPA